MKRFLKALLSVPVVLFSANAFGATLSPEVDMALQKLQANEELSVIVNLADKPDLTQFRNIEKRARRPKILKELKDKAELTQRPLKDLFAKRGVRRFAPLWITNQMAITAPANVVRELAKIPGVKSIQLDAVIQAPSPNYGTSAGTEWNVSALQAPDLWAMGFTGSGITVANLDTGVDWNHPDLSGKWRGGTNSWYDPNGQHTTPYDANGHGTQVMGIMVGGSSSGTNIGVAPDSKWIAVKIFNDMGTATLSTVHLGFQWLLDPDANPLTDDAPDVVNNSWSLGNINTCFNEFQNDTQVLKDAGISIVFSAGNDGPAPNTSMSPSNYSTTVSAGALDSALNIADFSSIGPSACNGGIYPTFTAPGVNIKTADLSYGGIIPYPYVYVSGTSFSAAHISGAMALLSSALPSATPAQLEGALKSTATDLGAIGPDNTYGYGLMRLADAYRSMVGSVAIDNDNDGYAADSDCNDNDPQIHPNAPEVKFDNIDQDCNGYDLTIRITRATYSAAYKTLRVEATSSLRGNANLEVVNYGPMTWNAKLNKWIASVRKVMSKPATVNVSGVEGIETAAVK
ncbi:MAG: S8 family serine peptidase [Deltaproteobacteria bacterium]|nr:S8 family serine peptidase [Deltaproteobacteria bacterium]